MGHCVYHVSYPYGTDRKVIEREMNERAEYESDSRNGLDNRIRWHEERTYLNRELAEKAIAGLDKGWYDNLAVRYLADKPAKTKKYEKLIERKKKLSEALREAEARYVFLKQFVTCPDCKSKIATEYMKSHSCPVCGKDLRPAPVTRKIEYLKAMLKEIDVKISDASEKKLEWLVKIEFHV